MIYPYGLTDYDYDFTDKARCREGYIALMLDRTRRMFSYSALPDTLPAIHLELMLQTSGHCLIFEHEGGIYAAVGGFGGRPDAYYFPTQYTVANPYLGLEKVFTIGEGCVLVKSDTLMQGLRPMMARYASLMVENDITMRMHDINGRSNILIEAPNDAVKMAADKYLEDLEKGERGTIAGNAFLDGLKPHPMTVSQGQRLTDFIEYHQYLKASWFNELGLQANYNMKRESINADEAQLNDDMLFPLVDDMLECRREGFEMVNDMFALDIAVTLGSSWEDNKRELEAELDALEDETDGEETDDEGIEDDKAE